MANGENLDKTSSVDQLPDSAQGSIDSVHIANIPKTVLMGRSNTGAEKPISGAEIDLADIVPLVSADEMRAAMGLNGALLAEISLPTKNGGEPICIGVVRVDKKIKDGYSLGNGGLSTCEYQVVSLAKEVDSESGATRYARAEKVSKEFTGSDGSKANEESGFASKGIAEGVGDVKERLFTVSASNKTAESGGFDFSNLDSASNAAMFICIVDGKLCVENPDGKLKAGITLADTSKLNVLNVGRGYVPFDELSGFDLTKIAESVKNAYSVQSEATILEPAAISPWAELIKDEIRKVAEGKTSPVIVRIVKESTDARVVSAAEQVREAEKKAVSSMVVMFAERLGVKDTREAVVVLDRSRGDLQELEKNLSHALGGNEVSADMGYLRALDLLNNAEAMLKRMFMAENVAQKVQRQEDIAKLLERAQAEWTLTTDFYVDRIDESTKKLSINSDMDRVRKACVEVTAARNTQEETPHEALFYYNKMEIVKSVMDGGMKDIISYTAATRMHEDVRKAIDIALDSIRSIERQQTDYGYESRTVHNALQAAHTIVDRYSKMVAELGDTSILVDDIRFVAEQNQTS